MLKLLRFGAIMVPIVFWFFTPLSEPIKKRLLHRYDIRWYSYYDNRTQTIAVHNEGDAPLPRITIALNTVTNSARPLRDFDFAHIPTDPRESFFHCISNPDSLNQLSVLERTNVALVLDEHSAAQTLYDVDRVFENILITRLKADNAIQPTLVDELHKNVGNGIYWHAACFKKCMIKSISAAECTALHSSFQKWEYDKQMLMQGAQKRWKEVTSVEVEFPNAQLSPAGKEFFSLPLNAEESGYLRVHYGPDNFKYSKPEVTASTIKEITEVDNLGDLDASSLMLIMKYHLADTILATAVFIIILLIMWPIVRPLSLLKTHKLFNLAIRTREHEYWEMALQRQRYFIVENFAALRVVLGRTSVERTTEQLLDYIRAQLTRVARYYPNEKELQEFIRAQLRFLVLTA